MIGVYRRTRNGRFEIFESKFNGEEVKNVTIARGIKERRTARIMAKSFEMYGLLGFMDLFANEKRLAGLIEKIDRIRNYVENEGKGEDPPEGV